MKICLSCGCLIIMSHRNDADCLKALSIEISRLQIRLQELEAAQQGMQAIRALEQRPTTGVEEIGPPSSKNTHSVSYDKLI